MKFGMFVRNSKKGTKPRKDLDHYYKERAIAYSRINKLNKTIDLLLETKLDLEAKLAMDRTDISIRKELGKVSSKLKKYSGMKRDIINKYA